MELPFVIFWHIEQYMTPFWLSFCWNCSIQFKTFHWVLKFRGHIQILFLPEWDQNPGPIAMTFGPFDTNASTRTYSLDISEVSILDQS